MLTSIYNTVFAGDSSDFQNNHIVIINGKEMFDDGSGSLLPIYTDQSGKKYVMFSSNISGSGAGLAVPIEKMFNHRTAKIRIKPKSGSFPDIVFVNNPVSWSQTYAYYGGYYSGKWASTPLGKSKTDTIRSSGCFVTSAAMMLATYGLRIGNYLTDPPNLNTWLTKNNGYVEEDSLKFSSLANFPGIADTYEICGKNTAEFPNGDHESYSNAYLAIYNHYEPLIVFKFNNLHYHCCVLIQTDGVKEHTYANKIINPDNHAYPENMHGRTQTIAESNLPWRNQLDPRFLVAVPQR